MASQALLDETSIISYFTLSSDNMASILLVIYLVTFFI